MDETPFYLSSVADTPGAPLVARQASRRLDAPIRSMTLPRVFQSFVVPSVGFFADDDTSFIQVVARHGDIVHIKVGPRNGEPLTQSASAKCLAHGRVVQTRTRTDGHYEYIWYNGEWKGAWTVCVV